MIIAALVGIYFFFIGTIAPMIWATIKSFIPIVVVIGLFIMGISLATEAKGINVNLGLGTIITFICMAIFKAALRLAIWVLKMSTRICVLAFIAASNGLTKKGVHPVLANILSAALVVAII